MKKRLSLLLTLALAFVLVAALPLSAKAASTPPKSYLNGTYYLSGIGKDVTEFGIRFDKKSYNSAEKRGLKKLKAQKAKTVIKNGYVYKYNYNGSIRTQQRYKLKVVKSYYSTYKISKNKSCKCIVYYIQYPDSTTGKLSNKCTQKIILNMSRTKCVSRLYKNGKVITDNVYGAKLS